MVYVSEGAWCSCSEEWVFFFHEREKGGSLSSRTIYRGFSLKTFYNPFILEVNSLNWKSTCFFLHSFRCFQNVLILYTSGSLDIRVKRCIYTSLLHLRHIKSAWFQIISNRLSHFSVSTMNTRGNKSKISSKFSSFRFSEKTTKIQCTLNLTPWQANTISC